MASQLMMMMIRPPFITTTIGRRRMDPSTEASGVSHDWSDQQPSSSSSKNCCKSCLRKEEKIGILSRNLEILQKSFRSTVLAVKTAKNEIKQKDFLIHSLTTTTNEQSSQQSTGSHSGEKREQKIQERIFDLETSLIFFSKQNNELKQEIQRLKSGATSDGVGEGGAKGGGEEEQQVTRDKESREESVVDWKLFRSRQSQTEGETAGQQQQQLTSSAKGQQQEARTVAAVDKSIQTEWPVMTNVQPVIITGVVHPNQHPQQPQPKIDLLPQATREVNEWKRSLEVMRLRAKIQDLNGQLDNQHKSCLFRSNRCCCCPDNSGKGQREGESRSHELTLVYVRNVLKEFLKTKEREKQKMILRALTTALDMQPPAATFY